MSEFVKSKKYIGVVYTLLSNGDKSYYITYKLSNKFHRTHIGKYSEGIREEFCWQKRNEAINNIKFGDGAPVINHKKREITTLNALANIYFNEKTGENKSNCKQHGRYDLHIKNILGYCNVYEITRDDILDLRNMLLQKRSPKTVNGIIQLLSAIINHSIKYKNLKIINPCSMIKSLKTDDNRERFLTKDEIKELKNIIANDAMLLLFVHLSLITGGRLETVLNIQKKDIDLVHGTINLKDIKNNSSYKGFLDYETENILSSSLPLLKINDYIVGGRPEKFPSRTIQRKLQGIMNKLFNEELDKKDSKNRVVIHSLRHTFASQLAISGTPIFTIQKLMNHADIKQTMRYAKLAPDSGKEYIQRLYI